MYGRTTAQKKTVEIQSTDIIKIDNSNKLISSPCQTVGSVGAFKSNSSSFFLLSNFRALLFSLSSSWILASLFIPLCLYMARKIGIAINNRIQPHHANPWKVSNSDKNASVSFEFRFLAKTQIIPRTNISARNHGNSAASTTRKRKTRPTCGHEVAGVFGLS